MNVDGLLKTDHVALANVLVSELVGQLVLDVRIVVLVILYMVGIAPNRISGQLAIHTY